MKYSYIIIMVSLVWTVRAKPSLDYDHHFQEAKGLLNELPGAELEEFFKLFVKEEMMDYLQTVPPSLSRSADFLMSIPCVHCMKNYLRCKNVCNQLVLESNVFFFDQFACLSVCWQRVVSCCVASSRSTVQLLNENEQGVDNNGTSTPEVHT
ncbi:uncharacterized protein LOC123503627 [Portunus trituberculatus]|uniref:uncharacterized protein LOC123503627 n=1 Tax=Portunus trituberculatus TaxID=210409 RepID=UPI001E1D1CEC|nr:uncharacterized protein LOC123503627 [Portunus trituberculatus]